MFNNPRHSDVSEFSGNFAFLSNFFPSPMNISGANWATVEHFYQACKTLDPIQAEVIREAETPGRAKRYGGNLQLRADWDQIKLQVMEFIVEQKFLQNPQLMERLKNTGNATLVEGNCWHDNFWGDCSCARCRNKPGQNQLGKILMSVRWRYSYVKVNPLEIMARGLQEVR
jgi:ribA/ribD-fused uncharacterized protein